jgi:hypothetical protein
MDSLCIICLNTLASTEASNADGPIPDRQPDEITPEPSDTAHPPKTDVAHLQNCRHTFHDYCITIWVEVSPIYC